MTTNILFFILGFQGIYKGLTPTILKQGSNQAIRFYCMETMKELYKGGDRDKKVPKPIVGVMGAIAGNCLRSIWD